MTEPIIPIQNVTPASIGDNYEENDGWKYFLGSYRQLKELQNASEEFKFTLLYLKDLKTFTHRQRKNMYYIPVFQEGYSETSATNNSLQKALITWGVQDCVVIAAYNPSNGIYMTHALFTNSFFRHRASTGDDLNLRPIEDPLVCRGEPIEESLPPWLSDPSTQVYLYSLGPGVLLSRIIQLRQVFHGPLTVYCGGSYDGSSAQLVGFRGTIRNKASYEVNAVMNERINPEKSSAVILTTSGFFGLLNEIPPTVKSDMDTMKEDIELRLKKENSSKMRSEERRCVYKANRGKIEWATAGPRRWPSPPPSPQPIFNPVLNPFEVLAIGGKKKQRKTRRLRKKTRKV
jgi:hypothetical protein